MEYIFFFFFFENDMLDTQKVKKKLKKLNKECRNIIIFYRDKSIQWFFLEAKICLQADEGSTGKVYSLRMFEYKVHSGGWRILFT